MSDPVWSFEMFFNPVAEFLLTKERLGQESLGEQQSPQVELLRDHLHRSEPEDGAEESLLRAGPRCQAAAILHDSASSLAAAACASMSLMAAACSLHIAFAVRSS